MTSTNPAVQRFVGATGDFGRMLGVDNRWAYNIIKQVGNYAESYQRNIVPLGIERSVEPAVARWRADVRAAAEIGRAGPGSAGRDVPRRPVPPLRRRQGRYLNKPRPTRSTSQQQG
jgi:hypothetical protein